MRNYAAPELFVDEYVADTMIASTDGVDASKNNAAYYCSEGANIHNSKNGHPGNNHNCWGYNCDIGNPGIDGDLCVGDIFGVGC